MRFDPHYNPYPSRRTTVYSRRGAVATSQPLAASAGLRVLAQGGNAIDAAVATAMALTVVEPCSNGIGGDAFALVWSGGQLHGLNASGPAPAAMTPAAVSAAGGGRIPRFGWVPVTVPGAPAAWARLSERFGRLPLTRVAEPAVEYAERGYPVSPAVALAWSAACRRYGQLGSSPEFAGWFETFAPGGAAPAAGTSWSSPGHARSLADIAETGAESFYRGALAEQLDACSRSTGGLLRLADLESYQPEWTSPIGVDYRGHTVWEMPPNGQGLVALMALQILEPLGFEAPLDPGVVHLQIEALKLAFADGLEHITDPQYLRVSVEQLLSESHARSRRRLLGPEARDPGVPAPLGGGTVYLATADGEGNMVSYIQSNYMGFGSGVVVPGTGIALQNRGHNFSLDPDHCNYLQPGKRPYHTIIPGFLTRGQEPVGPFGVMGGFMQPQGHLQVIMNALDFQLDPQACLDAPRWRWDGGNQISVESGFPAPLAQKLGRKGHQVGVSLAAGGFGRGQIIWRLDDGTLAAATEPRCDGLALGL